VENGVRGDIEALLDRIAHGDVQAVGQLLMEFRAPLKRMVAVYFDGRLQGRVDPSDIVQEAFIDASLGLADYASQRPVALYPWLRQIVWQRMIKVQEHHFAQKRSVNRERSQFLAPSSSSICQLIQNVAGPLDSPVDAMIRRESENELHDVLMRLSVNDRELLILRYLEQLSPHHCAEVLGISHSAFLKRHLRAVRRLRLVLDSYCKGQR
jgi:RNA polymerase sigma-70 factor (ECF subfamily)